MAKIISLANQKGGVGKTTTSFNLAAALAKAGKKVLLIDNDPQGNLSSYAGLEDFQGITTDQIYLSRIPRAILLSEVINFAPNMFLIPTDIALSGVDLYLMAKPEKEFFLKKSLENLNSEMDFIFIDNPPAVNLLTINGLVASDGVLIPLQMEFFSLEGVVHIEQTIRSIKDKNPNLKILGLLPNMFDARRNLHSEVRTLLTNEYNDLVFKTSIRDSVKVSESSGHGQSVLSYAPKNPASLEYEKLAGEFLERCQNLRN